jgi:hypothetical protein
MSSRASQLPPDSPADTVFTQLQQQPWFGRLQSQLAQRQEMQKLFDQECPLELTGQCRVLGFKYDCLQVELVSAAGATQLQFRTRELLAALRKYPLFAGLKKIQGQVARTLAVPRLVRGIQPKTVGPGLPRSQKHLARNDIDSKLLPQMVQSDANASPTGAVQKLSAQTMDMFKQLADSVTDPELKAALAKLAK